MFEEKHQISQNAVKLLIAVFVVFLIVPAVQEVVTRPQPSLFSRIADDRRRYGIEVTIQEVERHLIFDSRFADAVRQRYQRVLIEAFGKGSRTVFVSRDKSLVHRSAVTDIVGPSILSDRFLAEPPQGIDVVDAVIRKLRSPWKRVPPPPPSRPYAQSLDVITGLHRQLSGRGLQLVVVIVPTKLAIHPEEWSSAYPEAAGPAWNAGYADWRRRLVANGVDLVDLTDAFEERRAGPDAMFLEYDTHWSPHGVSAAADVVADHVRPFLKDVLPLSVELTHRTIVEPSDLRSLLGLRADNHVFPSRRVEVVEVTVVGDEAKATGDQAPVLLLGDSLTGYYDSNVEAQGRRAGFAWQLMARLHVGVQRFVGFGEQLPAVIQDVFENRSAALDHKQVVILEFSIYQVYSKNFSAAFTVPPGKPR